MTLDSLTTILPMLFGFLAAQPAAMQQPVSRLALRNGVIWRVPVVPRPPRQRIAWVERKGPRCISAAAIRRAFLSSPEQVDFVLADRNRVRAKFDRNCDALDFYGGFYLQMQDEFLCADRDAVHSRMGASCTIEKFRSLEPRPKG
ncbi:MAG: hypothetical protein ABIO29_05145 [Sphingomicrobium sp.]